MERFVEVCWIEEEKKGFVGYGDGILKGGMWGSVRVFGVSEGLRGRCYESKIGFVLDFLVLGSYERLWSKVVILLDVFLEMLFGAA